MKGLKADIEEFVKLENEFKDIRDVISIAGPEDTAALEHFKKDLSRIGQKLDSLEFRTLLSDEADKANAILSPDGNLILYLQDAGEGKTRIMRKPISGGAPEMVLDGKGINGLGCSWSPATLCVLGEETPDRKQSIFTAFDPMKGRGKELTRVTLKQPVETYFWDLTRDGSCLAFGQSISGSERRIQILPLSGGDAREVVVQREIKMSSLTWANDGRGFFVGTIPPEGMLLFVGLDGRTDVLWKRETRWGPGPLGLPSPDGRHLAMLGWTIDSNIWMLENF